MSEDHGAYLEAQMFALPPKARMVGGLSLAVIGAVCCVAMWEGGVIAGAAVFFVVLGLVLAESGRREHRRLRAIDAEVERAEAEWSDLQRDVGLARRTGQSAARLLQQRGYKEFGVRRWILARLEDEADAS